MAQTSISNLAKVTRSENNSETALNTTTKVNKERIREFLEKVRSGKYPEQAGLYMAESVLAHQMNSESQTTVKRTPANYEDHVREFLKMYGKFTFNITELIGDNDKVYVRWEQKGNHLAPFDTYLPTGKPLTEIASAVYRLKDGKIVEYWIQIDRFGFEQQLQANKGK